MQGRICVNCGRYIGARERCPYCGEKSKKPLSIQTLKWLSLFLSLFGLFFFFLALKFKEAPFLRVVELKPTMNFAQLRIKGTVTRFPYFDTEKNYLTLWLNDGTGDIMIKAYRNTAKKIFEQNKLPGIGDSVAVEGTLYSSPDFFFLTVNRSDKFSIYPLKEKEEIIPLGTLSEELLYQRVKVKGLVTGKKVFKGGSTLLFLGDEKGNRINVFIPSLLQEIYNEEIKVQKGELIQVAGTVTFYKDELEIVPRNIQDIEIIEIVKGDEEKEEIPKKPQYITKKGTIGEVKGFKKGVNFFLKEKEGKVLRCVIWKEKLLELNISPKLLTGSEVEFKGKIKEYKGEEELIVYYVKVISYPEEPLKLQDITEEKIGQAILVQGEVKEVKIFEPGVKVKLQDETGTAIVWIWKDVYSEFKKQIEKGQNIKVCGEVSEYKDILEIVPRVKTDIILQETEEEKEKK